MNAKVVTGALVVSLIANVYLLATRSSSPSASGTASAPAATSGPGRTMPGERRGAPARLPAAPELAPASSERAAQVEPGPLDPSTHDRESALAAQLLKAQADAEEHRPLQERFQEAPGGSPEIEEQARSALDKMFPAKPGQKPIYSVECHGVVCSLHFDEDRAPEDWMQTLQHAPERVQFRGMMFGAAGTYVEVAPPDYVEGARYASSLFDALRDSAGVKACKQRFPMPGDLVLGLERGPTRELRVTMIGSLADQPLAACLRQVAEQVLSQLPPPPANIESFPGGMAVRMPRSAPAPKPDTPKPPVERKAPHEHLASGPPLPS